ncbi:MAG: hypothetical protein KF795_13945 [Labilithrix sp.]|nr:hypothetical protein [Labilithrix sp.]
MVTDGRVSLRASAYVELHTWLAGAARTDEALEPALEPARRAYARSLRDDDADALLERTTRALSVCSDDRCSSSALAAEGFASAYERALPAFVARTWLGRATTAWIGLEAARAVLGELGPVADALVMRAASDLAVAWPERPVTIAVVSEAPPVGTAALAPVALATRGRCFAREASASRRPYERVDQARVLDCLLVHALSAVRAEAPAHTGALFAALTRELGARDGERAWALLAIHAVAAVVTGWEPKHRSVYRRSAEAVELPMLGWLAKEWRGAGAEAPETFAARYAARWREEHPAKK